MCVVWCGVCVIVYLCVLLHVRESLTLRLSRGEGQTPEFFAKRPAPTRWRGAF